MPAPERIPLIFGALIALLCQILVAPNIIVFYGEPNFVLAYIIAVAVANVRSENLVLAFVVGLIYGLMSSGPLGAMAFTCVLIMFLASQINAIMNNDTLFVPISILLISCYLAEFIYALLMIACGVDVSLLDALIYQVLPCGLYDNVIVVIAYFLVRRFAFSIRKTSEMKIIDSRVD